MTDDGPLGRERGDDEFGETVVVVVVVRIAGERSHDGEVSNVRLCRALGFPRGRRRREIVDVNVVLGVVRVDERSYWASVSCRGELGVALTLGCALLRLLLGLLRVADYA